MKKRFDIDVAIPIASHKLTTINSLLDSYPNPSNRIFGALLASE